MFLMSLMLQDATCKIRSRRNSANSTTGVKTLIFTHRKLKGNLSLCRADGPASVFFGFTRVSIAPYLQRDTEGGLLEDDQPQHPTSWVTHMW